MMRNWCRISKVCDQCVIAPFLRWFVPRKLHQFRVLVNKRNIVFIPAAGNSKNIYFIVELEVKCQVRTKSGDHCSAQFGLIYSILTLSFSFVDHSVEEKRHHDCGNWSVTQRISAIKPFLNTHSIVKMRSVSSFSYNHRFRCRW